MKTRSGAGPEGLAGSSDSGPLEDPRQRIRTALERVAAAQVELHAAVDAAREQALTWSAIGEALGVTRQAAHERFAKLDQRSC